METFLDIVDFILLLLLVAHVSRTVWKEQLLGSSSLLLTICIAVAASIFAIISYTSYMGLIAVISSPTRAILLVVLLVMFALIRLSWGSKTAA